MQSALTRITKRQLAILQYLHERGSLSEVRSIRISQDELAVKLKITRQALSNHLRKLRDMDLVRTGRRFIDITEEGLKILGETSENAFVFIRVRPQARTKVYREVQKLKHSIVYRVTGDIDLIALVKRKDLDAFLQNVSEIAGVEGTSAHIVLDQLRA
ncbi:MAG: Lrp/AsnC family transcriptional regulator [Candidatus Ranarchaeia archaeon]